MLDIYHRLARRLYGYRWALWLLCGIAVAVFAGAVLLPDVVGDERTITLGALVLLVWAICLMTLTYSFTAPLPAAGPDSGWLARKLIRLRRGFLWLMALAMSLLTVLVVILSFRVAVFMIR